MRKQQHAEDRRKRRHQRFYAAEKPDGAHRRLVAEQLPDQPWAKDRSRRRRHALNDPQRDKCRDIWREGTGERGGCKSGERREKQRLARKVVRQAPIKKQAETAAADIGGKHQLRGRPVSAEDFRQLRNGRQDEVGPCQR